MDAVKLGACGIKRLEITKKANPSIKIPILFCFSEFMMTKIDQIFNKIKLYLLNTFVPSTEVDLILFAHYTNQPYMHHLHKINTYFFCLASCFLIFLLITLPTELPSQSLRWQQRVEYTMEIFFDHEHHQFEGKQNLKLWNNSPDTLRKLFYHLYFNAFQPGSDMDVRSRLMPDPDPRIGGRIQLLSKDEIGYHKIKWIRQGQDKLQYSIHGTILEVQLTKPVKPGELVQIDMNFESQVPVQIRRSGRNNKEGIDYSMAQWYPKLCNYDEQGWHTPPYVAREFYAPWGDFDVTITMDKKYCIAATGILQNPEEVGCGYSDRSSNRSMKKWKFLATNVHDFVWAADPDYTHMTFKRKNDCILHFFFQDDEKTNEAWNQLPAIIDKALDFIESKYGPYPYHAYSFIQGGDGGMEYPMATLITGNRSINSLVGVSIHELMHSWYQMMLASNESLYPWMDEGFASYAEEEVINYLRKQKLISGEVEKDPHAETIANYRAFANSGLEEVLSTHADHYSTNRAYGMAAYNKGAVCLTQLKYIMGERAFDKGMLDYYWKWKFRHPNPNDFIRIMEMASDLELDWFKEYFVYTTKKVDYGIDSVFVFNNKTKCRLIRADLFPMPVELKITYADGSNELYYIPLNLMLGNKTFPPNIRVKRLDEWSWVNPYYEFEIDKALDEIKEIQLNPENQLIDVNSSNDLIRFNN